MPYLREVNFAGTIVAAFACALLLSLSVIPVANANSQALDQQHRQHPTAPTAPDSTDTTDSTDSTDSTDTTDTTDTTELKGSTNFKTAGGGRKIG